MPGHVEPAGRGRWKVVVEAGKDPVSGKRRRVVRYIQGRKGEAEDVMAQILAALERGTYIEPSRLTVGEWLETWLNDYKKMTLRPTTWESYEVIYRNHILPTVGALGLQELRPEHLQKLYNDKVGSGLSSQTVRHIHKVIHGALDQALKNQLVVRNVSDAVTLPRLKRKEPRALAFPEQERLLGVLQGDRLGAAFLVLLGTGIRRGELLGLRWCDVDGDRGILYIRRSLVWTRSGITYQEPKTDKSRRAVPLPELLREELQRHRARMEEEGHAGSEAPVFCTAAGTPIIPRNLNRKFYELVEKAGINGLNLHALRHTFATRLLEEGEGLKVVQELLGHARIDTTADIYSHVSPELKWRAAEKMNRILAAGTKRAPKKGFEEPSKPQNP